MLTGPKELQVDVPNPDGTGTHKLAYYQWGDDDAERTVLCVHGLTRNGRDFDILARELAAHDCRVLCPDMPGRGNSQWMDIPYYNPVNYVTDLVHLLTHAGVDKVEWIGTSMGGIIAMVFAGMQPGRIRTLVLNDIGCTIPILGLTRITSGIADRPKFTTRVQAEEWLRNKSLAGFGIRDEAHWRHMFDHSIWQDGDEWKLRYDSRVALPLHFPEGVEPQDVDLIPFCAALATIPTLLISGGQSDLVTPEIAQKTQGLWNKDVVFRHYIVAGAGHAPCLMNEDELAVISGWVLRA